MKNIQPLFVKKLYPITTKYSGPTNFRGARISVKDVNNTRREISWNYEGTPMMNHFAAVSAFSTYNGSMHELEEMCSGFVEEKDGYTFFFQFPIWVEKAPKKKLSESPQAIKAREERKARGDIRRAWKAKTAEERKVIRDAEREALAKAHWDQQHWWTKEPFPGRKNI